MRRSYSEFERRGRAPARRMRYAVFIGVMGLMLAVLGASVDPNHRLNGFLFGGFGGLVIGVALLAFPRDEDYPKDWIDKSLD